MAIDSVASRAAGYGFPGVSVDGTNLQEGYAATKVAVDRARNGDGPTLIEANVERLLPHTTDDDHTRYRSAEDIEHMSKRDPVKITSSLLLGKGLLTEAEEEAIHSEAKKQVNVATDAVESEPFAGVENILENVTESTEPTR